MDTVGRDAAYIRYESARIARKSGQTFGVTPCHDLTVAEDIDEPRRGVMLPNDLSELQTQCQGSQGYRDESRDPGVVQGSG